MRDRIARQRGAGHPKAVRMWEGDATVLNYLTVLGAGLASFVFGAIWYGALAKPWQAARGLERATPQPAPPRLGPIPVAYFLALVAELVMAWMLAGVMLHLARGGLAPSPRTGAIAAARLCCVCAATTT